MLIFTGVFGAVCNDVDEDIRKYGKVRTPEEFIPEDMDSGRFCRNCLSCWGCILIFSIPALPTLMA